MQHLFPTPPAARWFLPGEHATVEVRRLADALGCPEALASLLWSRGFRRNEAARRFLSPRLRTLGDLYALPDLKPAVARLLRAIDARERIVLYGDYDVDGVT